MASGFILNEGGGHVLAENGVDAVVQEDFASGSAVTGTITASTSNTTSSISGAFGPSGSIAASTANTTSAITAAFGPSGTIGASTANTTSAITANYGPTGTIADTLADTTSSITGSFSAASGASGTIAANTADTTSSISGAFGPSGTLTATSQDTTSALSGLVANPVTGTIAVTLDDTTSQIVGSGGVVVDDPGTHSGGWSSEKPVPYRPKPKPSLWDKYERPESLELIKGYMFASTGDCSMTSAGAFDNTPNIRRTEEDDLLLLLV